MNYLIATPGIFLIVTTASLAQKNAFSDSSYVIRDSISIPTRSGIDISATIVQKKSSSIFKNK